MLLATSKTVYQPSQLPKLKDKLSVRNLPNLLYKSKSLNNTKKQ